MQQTIYQMTKTDLIKTVSLKTKLPQTQVSPVLDSILEEITNTLTNGEYIQFLQFGKFCVKKRASRKNVNIRDKSIITIPEKQVPFFRASSALKEKVNTAISIKK